MSNVREASSLPAAISMVRPALGASETVSWLPRLSRSMGRTMVSTVCGKCGTRSPVTASRLAASRPRGSCGWQEYRERQGTLPDHDTQSPQGRYPARFGSSRVSRRGTESAVDRGHYLCSNRSRVGLFGVCDTRVLS